MLANPPAAFDTPYALAAQRERAAFDPDAEPATLLTFAARRNAATAAMSSAACLR